MTDELTRLRAQVQQLTAERDEARAAIRDIDAHATPIGLLDENDPEGSPHHYVVTVGALHRALAKGGTAEPCESERHRLRELLHAIWLYVDWRYVTRQLTTPQKELWADAVDAGGDPNEPSAKADRWWRESFVAPQASEVA